MDPAEFYADQAGQAWVTMQRRFWGARGGGYRRREGWWRPGAWEHVWPFARAFISALDLAGLPGHLVPGGFDPDAVIAAHLTALAHYWDPADSPGAYASDPVGSRFGGDRYYDDNAWLGLALVQLERLRPGTAGLERARELFAFAAAGWDERADAPLPGGVFWVEQGRGIGRRNHDRNTVSNAPNAQLALHLVVLGAAGDDELTAAERMIAWVHAAMAAPGSDGRLFRDKVRGDGSIDAALWSYNQGSMVGAHVLRHRAGRSVQALAAAEGIARAVLAWPLSRLIGQPPAFNAILFRNLLQLGAAGAGDELRAAIQAALRAYADALLARPRDRHGLIRAGDEPATLLDQSAAVSVLALLAWDPAGCDRLA
ncbi:MAG: glycoside hydrolase family 76 protein [Actinomycetota bacterium]|nr:glycoside hydrolase family 76 protein [Actinomycetota bacterium]